MPLELDPHLVSRAPKGETGHKNGARAFIEIGSFDQSYLASV